MVGQPRPSDAVINEKAVTYAQNRKLYDLSGEIEWKSQRVLHITEGMESLKTLVRMPTNSFVKQAYELMVYSELAQCAERLRSVNVAEPKMLYYLGLEPIPDISVNEVVEYSLGLRQVALGETEGDELRPS